MKPKSTYDRHLKAIEKSSMSIASYARKYGVNVRSLYQARSRAVDQADLKIKQTTGLTKDQFVELPIVRPPMSTKLARRMELIQDENGFWSLSLSSLNTSTVKEILNHI